jgi:DNA-binding winged helix-turn-helix (wHTH) protein/TolB-like protein/Flp pilus assembly protein TadD
MNPATEPPVLSAQGQLQVGAWTLEPDLNQLSAAGKTVKVEPKAMAVLLCLASRAGQVVSRETLIADAWPDVIVGDDSLTQVIIKLRKALEDDPDRPAYIQTVTKRGYRLVASVSRAVEQRAFPVPHRSSRAYWIAGGCGLALLLASGVWWIANRHATRPLPGAGPVAELAQPPTVAILPFVALGKEGKELVLARGITADLLADLAKLPSLAVIGFSPMEGRSGSDASSHPEARYLVSGTVQRIDDRLRVHIYLTEQNTGRQLWSERFDRSVEELFAIQDELAPKIVRMLPAKVSEAELRRMAHRHTRNLQAYEYFQRGQAALLVRQKSENETAREMFRRAIELDTTFARAYSGLALTYAADYRNRWTADSASALDRAFELARTANEINPDVPETHWALAYVHAQRRQHEQALEYLEKATSMYPSFADGYALMASVRTYAGQPAAAIPLMRTAMRLNPKAGYLYFLVLGRAYFFVGDLEQAHVNLEEALKRNSGYTETHVYMAALKVLQRDNSSAAWEADQIRVLDPEFSARRWLGSYPMTDDAQKAKLLRALGQLGL